MNSFEIKTIIKFGTGSLNFLEEIINKKVLIITDPFMVESNGIIKITSKLVNAEYKVFSDIVPDPPIETITKGIEIFKDYMPDTIVALGGGSAIDAAKAIMEFSRKIVKKENVDFIAIPTTSGTGSEVTAFSVITDKEKGIKYPLVSDELIPDIAILDPELTRTVPKSITADTGMDVLTHAIEAYVSTKSNDFSDALAEKAIDLTFKYLVRAYENGDDMEAREKMHSASCLAGMAFNQTSLGINHSIAHSIGGKLKVPHGRINAILLPYVIEYNSDIIGYNNQKYSLAAVKYGKIANAIGCGSPNTKTAVKNLISEIKRLQKEMQMPTRLSQCGITSEDFEAAIVGLPFTAMNDTCTATNPKITKEADILEIIKKIK